MIQVSIYRNARGERIGFHTAGHADYEDSGRDISCAAVSVLELNLANSVSEFTDARFQTRIDEKSGEFDFRLADTGSKEAVLLLNSCLLGFQAVSREYGKKYLTITDEEV